MRFRIRHRLLALPLFCIAGLAHAGPRPSGGDPGLSPFLRNPLTTQLKLLGAANGSEPVTCASGQAGALVYSTTDAGLRVCNGSSWGAVGGSGSVAFSGVTAGTNGVALVVGTGGSLTVSGSGTITATGLTGAVTGATSVSVSGTYKLGGTTIYAQAGGTDSLQLGGSAGANLSSGTEATLIGSKAGNAVTSNTAFTAVGASAGLKATGAYTTYVGAEAGAFYSASSGGFNTGMGALVMQDVTGGALNAAFGYNALTHVTSGGTNNGFGYATGVANAGAPNSANLTTGSDNIMIGSLAGVDAAGAGVRLSIGQGAVAKVDNTAVIGSAAPGEHYTNIFFGYGYDKASIGTVTVGINATGGLGTDQPGASLLINGGVSTGTGAPGRIGFQISPAAGSTSSSRNALVEVAKFAPKGHLVLTELTTDPATTDVTDAAAMAVYRKSDKIVIAINIGGTMNYLTTPADGVGTAGTAVFTWSTSAP